jgi:hypothetical protein
MLAFALGVGTSLGENCSSERRTIVAKPVLRQPFAVTNVGRESASELRAPALLPVAFQA